MSGPTVLRLEVETRSDLHVGSGEALGTIDALVARDADGLPEIPGSTLRGVLRDSAERVAAALDAAQGGAGWSGLVEAVLGSQPSVEEARSAGPRPGAVTIRSARLAGPVRAALGDPALRATLTSVRHQVAIDRRSGTAGDDLLRVIEVVRPGLRLTSEVTLDTARLGPAAAAARALLAAAAAATTRVGGGRRRGLGRVRSRLLDEDGTELATDDLASLLGAPPPAAAPVPSAEAATAPRVAGEAGTGAAPGAPDPARAVWVRITTVDPVVVTRRSVGNVAESEDHVPGRVLLPLVAAAVASLGGDPGPAIGAGLLRVTDATPLVGGVAGAPTPLCLAGRAGAEDVVNRLEADPGPGAKPQRGGFVADDGAGALHRVTTPIALHLHNVIDDRSGRVGDAESGGGLFGSEVIEAGVVLGCHVVVDPRTGVDADALAAALTGPAAIGTARRASYGRVRLEAAADATAAPPVEWGTGGVDVPADGVLTLWLLSDAVLLDPATLGPSPTVRALVREVAAALGVDEGDLETVPDGVHVRAGRLDAWQARWGTPRPTLPTLRAGGVVRLRTRVAIPAAATTALVRGGVGERRGEGFGRLAVDPDWAGRGRLTLRAADPTAPDGDDAARAPLTAADEALLAALRADAVRARAGGLVDVAARPARGHPLDLRALSRAQRGLLRAAAARAAVTGSADPLRGFVADQRAGDGRRSAGGGSRDDRWRDRPELLDAAEGLIAAGDGAAADGSPLEGLLALAAGAGLDAPSAAEIAGLPGPDRVRLVAALLTASVRAAEEGR